MKLVAEKLYERVQVGVERDRDRVRCARVFPRFLRYAIVMAICVMQPGRLPNCTNAHGREDHRGYAPLAYADSKYRSQVFELILMGSIKVSRPLSLSSSSSQTGRTNGAKPVFGDADG